MIALGWALPPPGIAAQTIRGLIIDDGARSPLAGAVVSVAGIDRETRSDSLGRFILHVGSPRTVTLKVNRIGYSPFTSRPVALSPGIIVDLVVGMTLVATRLGTISVVATTRLTRDELMSHVGFDLRKSKGVGKFMDSTDLELFSRIPIGFALEERSGELGLQMRGTERNVTDTLFMRVGTNFCTPEVWIDGFEVSPVRAVERLNGLGSNEVYGVEIFKAGEFPSSAIGGLIGGGTIFPMGFKSSPASSIRRPPQKCGAIAVWTKAYAAEVRARARRH